MTGDGAARYTTTSRGAGPALRKSVLPEIRKSFDSRAAWLAWSAQAPDYGRVRAAILEHVGRNGFVEPLTGRRAPAGEVRILPQSLRESVSWREMNARKRALLHQFERELRARGWIDRRDLRILGAEGVTRAALVLRGLYPFFLGTEYLPEPADKARFFPVPHGDLQRLEFPDAVFDAFYSGDVFEHVPDLDAALAEILRVLRPGGLLVSSFPFLPSYATTERRARIGAGGEVEHLAPPEYHDNPAAPEKGSLVFSLPGWDILDKLRQLGAAEAYFTLVASARHGVVANGPAGVFILTAVKGGAASAPRPRDMVDTAGQPRGVCAIAALPRSGTTLLTSLFAVHSKVSASYEPWNGKRLPQNQPADLGQLIAAEKLGDVTGRLVIVKETGAKPVFLDRLRGMVERAPETIERHMLGILRDPAQTLLSEFSRRSEWWGDAVTLGPESLDVWCARSRVALAKLIAFAEDADGALVTLESLAADPARVLGQLAPRLGLSVEPRQLDYEAHLDKTRVRGDRNVAEAPAPVDLARVVSRGDRAAEVAALAAASVHREWFGAFSELHRAVEAAGGVTPARHTPVALRRTLRAGA